MSYFNRISQMYRDDQGGKYFAAVMESRLISYELLACEEF